jgi:hypothetical protein
MKKEASVPV